MINARTIPGLTFHVHFDSERGMKTATIHAYSVADMIRQMREQFPSDIGADGFYDYPITGDTYGLVW
jgi:hypothetical protein